MWGPILIDYIMEIGHMTLAEVYFMEAVCVAVSVIMQAPTGAFADRLGRTMSMRIGVLFQWAHVLCDVCATGRKMLWFANFLWAIGTSFVLGADEALLYDALGDEKRSDESRKIIGRALGYTMILSAVCAPISTYLYQINKRLPLMIDLCTVFISVVVVFSLTERERNVTVRQRTYLVHMKRSCLMVWRSPRIIWAILFSTIVHVVGKLWFFMYNPYFRLTKLPVMYWGVLFSAMNIVAAVSSYYADEFAKWIRSSSAVRILLACIALPMIAMGLLIYPSSSIFCVAQNFVRGFGKPFMSLMCNRAMPSDERATMNSICTSIKQGFEVVAMAVFAGCIAYVSIPCALIVLGCAVLFLSVPLMYHFFRCFPEEA